MFESKLILKLPPFSFTYTVREKRRQFQNELTLKHSEVILELSWLYQMAIRSIHMIVIRRKIDEL